MLLSASGGLEPLLPNDPDIAPVGSDPGSPFSLPFSTKNGSLVFAMHNVSITCLIDHIRTRDGSTIDDSEFTRPFPTFINTRDTKNFGCGILISANNVVDAKIRVSQTYGLRWLGKRTYTTEPFIWTRTSDGGRWIKGLIY